jgi:hypothetical protein
MDTEERRDFARLHEVTEKLQGHVAWLDELDRDVLLKHLDAGGFYGVRGSVLRCPLAREITHYLDEEGYPGYEVSLTTAGLLVRFNVYRFWNQMHGVAIGDNLAAFIRAFDHGELPQLVDPDHNACLDTLLAEAEIEMLT